MMPDKARLDNIRRAFVGKEWYRSEKRCHPTMWDPVTLFGNASPKSVENSPYNQDRSPFPPRQRSGTHASALL